WTASCIMGTCSNPVRGAGGPKRQPLPLEPLNESAAARLFWSKTKSEEGFLYGDSVPKPLGFSAFPPEMAVLFGAAVGAPPFSGRWVGARVASLRCPILRPGEDSINRVAWRRKIYEKLL